MIRAPNRAVRMARKKTSSEHDTRPEDDNLRLARQSVGKSYFDSKRFDEALASVQQEIAIAGAIVQKSPKDAISLSKLSNAHFGQGMVRNEGGKVGWEEAIRIGIVYIQNAADVDKKNPQYLNELGKYRKYLAGKLAAVPLKEEAKVEYGLALKAYQQAASLSLGDADALQGIRELDPPPIPWTPS